MGYASNINEHASRLNADAHRQWADTKRSAEGMYERGQQNMKDRMGTNTVGDKATYYSHEAQRQAAGVKDAAQQYGQHGVSYTREEVNEMGERINQLSEQMRQHINQVNQDTMESVRRMTEAQQAQLENLRESVRTGDWSKKAGEYMPNVNAYKDEDSNQYCVSAGQKGAHSCAPAYGVWGAMTLFVVILGALFLRRQQPHMFKDQRKRNLEKNGLTEVQPSELAHDAAKEAERTGHKSV